MTPKEKVISRADQWFKEILKRGDVLPHELALFLSVAEWRNALEGSFITKHTPRPPPLPQPTPTLPPPPKPFNGRRSDAALTRPLAIKAQAHSGLHKLGERDVLLPPALTRVDEEVTEVTPYTESPTLRALLNECRDARAS